MLSNYFFTKYNYFVNCFCDLTVVGARICDEQIYFDFGNSV
jgi:hypothetical protein